MKDINENYPNKLAEVKIKYSTRIKTTDRIKITSPDDAFNLFRDIWDKETIEHIEEVKLMLLNRANCVLGFVNLSKGGITGSVIDVKVILQYAIKSNSNGVILAHNHPSGNLMPGESDKQITKTVKQGLQMVDINLLDHLIIIPDKMYNSIIDLV